MRDVVAVNRKMREAEPQLLALLFRDFDITTKQDMRKANEFSKQATEGVVIQFKEKCNGAESELFLPDRAYSFGGDSFWSHINKRHFRSALAKAIREANGVDLVYRLKAGALDDVYGNIHVSMRKHSDQPATTLWWNLFQMLPNRVTNLIAAAMTFELKSLVADCEKGWSHLSTRAVAQALHTGLFQVLDASHAIAKNSAVAIADGMPYIYEYVDKVQPGYGKDFCKKLAKACSGFEDDDPTNILQLALLSIHEMELDAWESCIHAYIVEQADPAELNLALAQRKVLRCKNSLKVSQNATALKADDEDKYHGRIATKKEALDKAFHEVAEAQKLCASETLVLT